MTRAEIFGVWSPTQSTWARWVKPVLFAHMKDDEPVLQARADELTAQAQSADLGWTQTVGGRMALVLDLPGSSAISVAAALALQRGYRPVPLYNGIPTPTATAAAWVDTAPILSALVDCSMLLRSLSLADAAPPAFLLDANRAGLKDKTFSADEPCFDNRSLSFPTDFPSGGMLKAQGLERVLLVQMDSWQPSRDLSYTLHLWQNEGLRISTLSLAEVTDGPRDVVVGRPSWLGWVLHRAASLLGLSRNPIGGFGALAASG